MTRRQYEKAYKDNVRIIFNGVPGKLRMTSKVIEKLDDYMSGQFSDGWGEGFFYPYNRIRLGDGTIIAVE